MSARKKLGIFPTEIPNTLFSPKPIGAAGALEFLITKFNFLKEKKYSRG